METKKVVKYGGRIVGTIYYLENGSVAFIKSAIPSKHLLRNGNAYGIQSCIWEKLFKGQKGFIRINELEDPKRSLEASIKTWDSKGWDRNFGSGKQRFLGVDLMEDKNIRNRRLEL